MVMMVAASWRRDGRSFFSFQTLQTHFFAMFLHGLDTDDVHLAIHRALRRMAGLVFLLVFWVLAGACQRHDGVDGFLLCNSPSSSSLGHLLPFLVFRFFFVA